MLDKMPEPEAPKPDLRKQAVAALLAMDGVGDDTTEAARNAVGAWSDAQEARVKAGEIPAIKETVDTTNITLNMERAEMYWDGGLTPNALEAFDDASEELAQIMTVAIEKLAELQALQARIQGRIAEIHE